MTYALISAFAACICDNYQNLMNWLVICHRSSQHSLLLYVIITISYELACFLEYVFAIGPSQHSLLLYVIINNFLCAGSFSWSMYLT